MKPYNDYTATVKRWLRNYRSFKTYVQNADDEIAAREKAIYLDTVASVAIYSGENRGGAGELSHVEYLADKHLEKEKEFAAERASVENLRHTLNKLDRALDTLTDTERKLIIGQYMDGMTWDELGREFNYTGKWARMKGAKAIQSIAVMLFGAIAISDTRAGVVLLA